ncbi:MAG: hypothetical protein ACTSUQ_08350 [Candidatus Freyarchaeota archaeon]
MGRRDESKTYTQLFWRIQVAPPKTFCIDCFDTEIKCFEVALLGHIYTYGVSYFDLDGSKLEKPIIWALTTFEEVEG